MSKQFIIVGGGPAATNAMETIRQYDTESTITLVSDEPTHSRMALPYWLSNQIPREQTHTGDDAYFQKLNVNARIGQRVSHIDDRQQTIQLDSGDTLDFDALLIATGSSPLPLPVSGADLPGVHHLWTLADTEQVLNSAQDLKQPEVVMIGAGFIGLIVLNAMHKRDWKLTVIERDMQVLPRMLDRQAAGIAGTWLAEQEVDVLTDANVTAIETDDQGKKRVLLDGGATVSADIVIIATGVRPNRSIVDGTSVDVDQGILVDHHLRTNVPSIYAAGDVAQGPVRFSDAREIHAIQPTAVDHGRIAGANMAGQEIEFKGSLAMNVLDVCGLQCASFGHWDDLSAEAMTIENTQDSIYRCLRWTNDQLTGAIFVGRANDMGMLTDVGMAKGLIQTGVHLGEWKDHLRDNPFDIRRVFVAKKVPHLLMQETLLGSPAKARQFRYQQTPAQHQPGGSHDIYVRSQP